MKIKACKKNLIKKEKLNIITLVLLDHAGMSASLLKNFKVDKVIFNNDSYNTLEKSLIKKLNQRKIKYYNISIISSIFDINNFEILY